MAFCQQHAGNVSEPDYDYWLELPLWAAQEGLALILGRDPRSLSWDIVQHLVGVSEFADEFARARDLFIRDRETLHLPYRVPPRTSSLSGQQMRASTCRDPCVAVRYALPFLDSCSGSLILETRSIARWRQMSRSKEQRHRERMVEAVKRKKRVNRLTTQSPRILLHLRRPISQLKSALPPSRSSLEWPWGVMVTSPEKAVAPPSV
jgi:hypothetical protein